MNTRALTFLTSVLVLSSAAQAQAISPTHAGAALNAAQIRVLSGSESFVENKGQWDGRVQFLARSPGLNMWITDEGMVMDYHQFVPDRVQTREQGNKFWRPTGTIYGDVVKFTLENTQPTAFTGGTRVQGDFNYFIGNDPGMWASSVHRFAEAKAENPYPGIAVRYYFDQNSPRYDLIVEPGADPSQVSLKVEGVQGTRVRPDGSLELKTPYGTISENGLAAFQVMNGQKTQISCSLAVDGDRIRFDAGQYDPAKPLIIDPLVFSTFLGGNDNDWATALVLDSLGEPVITGSTESSDFPVTSGAYQKSTTAGFTGFVSKLSADGTRLLVSTYLGGSRGDLFYAIALDSVGNPVVCGATDSNDFPTTPGAYQGTNRAASNKEFNAFISKLSADGTKLLASTYLGGSGNVSLSHTIDEGDWFFGLALDTADNPIVAGDSISSDFPTTPGAYQPTNRAFAADGCNVVVSKLSADETKLLESTYLGGTGNDQANAIALDSSGNPVIGGFTESFDFPTTVGAYQKTKKSQTFYATTFVSKLSADETKLLSSTYLGGTGNDTIYALALDPVDNPVVAGSTVSSDFPTTAGVYQPMNNGTAKGASNGFVAKLTADGTKLVFSTFLGGSGFEGDYSFIEGDSILAVCLDKYGDPIIAGSANSRDFPITAGAFQTTSKLGEWGWETGFISKLDAHGRQLLESTYLGGSNRDACYAMALDNQNNPVVAGETFSTDFPTTAGAYMTTMAPDEGLFVFISKLQIPPFTLQTPVSMIGPAQFQASATITTFGLTIGLSGSPKSVVTVPSRVILAQGQVLASFPISVNEVDTSTPVTITGISGSFNGTATFTVLPIPVSSLTMPASCIGGKSVQATVTSLAPFGTGHTGMVALSANSSVVAIPQTATIPSGSSQVSFQVSTVLVAETTPVQITATLGGASETATLDVQPVSSIKELTLLTPCVGGATIEGVISCAAYVGPLGGIVTLSSNGPEATVPASVTIPPGGCDIMFHFTTTAVAKPTFLIISASYGGVTKQANLTILPAP